MSDLPKYLEDDGVFCPKCRSDDIETIERIVPGIGGNTQTVRCNACKAVWRDLYKLVDFDIIDEGNLA